MYKFKTCGKLLVFTLANTIGPLLSFSISSGATFVR